MVIVLNTSTEASHFVSVETGGVVFEDPAWAVLAAYAVSRVPRFGVPLASENRDLWQRLQKLQKATLIGKYAESDFFGAVSGFIGPASQPKFSLMQVTAEQMSALRTRGVQSFGKPLRFYELFQHPKATR